MLSKNLPLLTASLLGFAGIHKAAAAAPSCKASSIKVPDIFGLQITDIQTEEVKQWNSYGMVALPPLPNERKPIDFCSVAITYTHPGLNDTIHVNVWLPLEESSWNGRFLGQGGGGWAAGGADVLGPGVSLGFAAADTDAGHNYLGHPGETVLSSKSWSLTSPGNVDMVLLQNFAYRAVDDMTRIAKEVVKSYYGRAAKHSYWNGCSTGGRQGLMTAQRHPGHYDGILAAAPAINWVTFLVAEFWPQVVMKKLNYFPPACELNAITQAAIEACDGLDGVKDGLISAPRLCTFDARSVVGQKYDCEGDSRKISKNAAEIANVAWNGLELDGEKIWFGLSHEASLAGIDPFFRGLVSTNCDAKNKNCKSSPFPISADWVRHFVLKDTDYDLSTITEDEFLDLLRTSRQQYHSIMNSADPDLRAFNKAGGKIISWHGLADQLIFPNGSTNYYHQVSAISPDVDDFFRFFEVPGVAHCFGGPGAFPLNAIHSLVDWVEKGVAPAKLDGQSIPMAEGETVKSRPLCPYPQVAAYKGGASDQASSFECADSFDAFGRAHDEL